MSFLQNKNILIISPQDWGKMMLSKHHYALELARKGNRVYFLNPPDQTGTLPRNSLNIKESGLDKNLFFINHRVFFPYWIRFRSVRLFHWLMKMHVRKLLSATGSVDIVWSFDLGNTYPFSSFPQTCIKIFHPVDEPLTHQAIKAAKGADILFSVTNEILSKYRHFNRPSYFIHHGVKEEFIKILDEQVRSDTGRRKVGYSGNMLRDDIDRNSILQIVRENPDIEFNFFGSYKLGQTNIGGNENAEQVHFLSELEKSSNVKLHGVLNQQQLAMAFAQMDAFLVSYDILKDQSKGTNYHKLMEYIATGKVIISNNITTYQAHPELIQMTESRTDNKLLPELFKKVMNALEIHNAPGLLKIRREFAADNTYPKQLQKIDAIMSNVFHK